MSGKTRQEEKKSRKWLFILLFIGIAVIIALLVVLIIRSNSNKTRELVTINDENTPKREVLVTEENAERIAEQLLTADSDEDSGVPVQYTVTMKSKWHFKNGESASDDAYVANNEANTTDVYFDVVRNDTQEVVYSSPVLPVGTDISNFKLDQDLEAGVYECTLIYYLVDKDQNVLTNVNMWVELTIDS